MKFFVTIFISLFLLASCGLYSFGDDHGEYKNINSSIYFDPPGEDCEKGCNPKMVEGADADSFKDLGCGYGKDKYHAFAREEVIPGVSLNDFKLLDCHAAMDKDNVYLGQYRLANSDPNSFEFLNYYYSRDANNVYYSDKLIDNVNRDDFSVFDDQKDDPYGFRWDINESQYYAKDGDHVYFLGDVIEDANPDTFVILESLYGKDELNVYYGGEKLNGRRPQSFKFLNNARLFGYSKDDFSVYWGTGDRIEGADAETFELLRQPEERYAEIIGYGHDKDNVYYEGKKIEGEVDGPTFEFIYNLSGYLSYAKDKSGVYFLRTIDDVRIAQSIEEALPSNFKIVGNQYHSFPFTRSGNNIYYWGKKLENVDAQTFEVVNYRYSKDKNSVFAMVEKVEKYGEYVFVKLEDSDPETFEVVLGKMDANDYYSDLAKDSKHFYSNGGEVGATEFNELSLETW